MARATLIEREGRQSVARATLVEREARQGVARATIVEREARQGVALAMLVKREARHGVAGATVVERGARRGEETLERLVSIGSLVITACGGGGGGRLWGIDWCLPRFLRFSVPKSANMLSFMVALIFFQKRLQAFDDDAPRMDCAWIAHGLRMDWVDQRSKGLSVALFADDWTKGLLGEPSARQGSRVPLLDEPPARQGSLGPLLGEPPARQGSLGPLLGEPPA